MTKKISENSAMPIRPDVGYARRFSVAPMMDWTDEASLLRTFNVLV